MSNKVILFLAATLTLASGATLSAVLKRRRSAPKSDIIHHEYHGPGAPLAKDGRVIDTPEVMKARADHLAIHAETVIDLMKKMAEANAQNEKEHKYKHKEEEKKEEEKKEEKKEEEKKEEEKKEEEKKEEAAPIVVASVEMTPELMEILTAAAEEKKEEVKPVEEPNAEEAPAAEAAEEKTPAEEAAAPVEEAAPAAEEEKKEEEKKEEEKKEEEKKEEEKKEENKEEEKVEEKKEEEKVEEKKEEEKVEEKKEEEKVEEKKEEEKKEEEKKEEEKKEEEKKEEEKKEETKEEEKKEEEKSEEKKKKREEEKKEEKKEEVKPVVEAEEINEIDHEHPVYIHHHQQSYKGPIAPLAEDGRVLDTPEVRKAKEAHVLAYEHAVKLAKAQAAAKEGELPAWYESRKKISSPVVHLLYHHDGPIGYKGPYAPIDHLGRVIDTAEVERAKAVHKRAHEQAIELAKLHPPKPEDNTV